MSHTKILKAGFSLICYLVIGGCFVVGMTETSLSQTPMEDLSVLEFQGVKYAYLKDEPIEFMVRNNTLKKLVFYCSVEKKIDENWREVILSIENKTVSKSVRLNSIKPGEIISLSWDYSKQSYYTIDNGIFRLAMQVYKQQGETESVKILSNEFIIKEGIGDDLK